MSDEGRRRDRRDRGQRRDSGNRRERGEQRGRGDRQEYLDLADAISQVRAELDRARTEGEGQGLRFEVEKVSLEFAVQLHRGGDGKLGLRVGVVTADLGGAAARDVTHRIQVDLVPERDGGPAYVGRGDGPAYVSRGGGPARVGRGGGAAAGLPEDGADGQPDTRGADRRRGAPEEQQSEIPAGGREDSDRSGIRAGGPSDGLARG
jgi:hypothetical protein